jgi:hypothetical protein
MSAFNKHLNGPLGYEQYVELRNECERKNKEEQTEHEKRQDEMYELDRFLVCCFMLKKINMLSKGAREKLRDIEDEWEKYIVDTILTHERYKYVRKLIYEHITISELYNIVKSLPVSFKELFMAMHREHIQEVVKVVEDRINEQ